MGGEKMTQAPTQLTWPSKLKPVFLRLNKSPLLNTWFESISVNYAEANDGVFNLYRDATDEKKRRALCTARRIKSETDLGLYDVEACQLSALVDATAKIEGDMAEVGTFKGGSAKIICEVKGDRPLHLFDTFEGIPEVEKIDAGRFAVGQYAAPLETVMNYLREYPNVFFYKGMFPTTAKPVEGKTFSFVHLDVDTYKSTLSCLEFFYPRMSTGGIILSHDYPFIFGVTRAFDEFFGDRLEPIIPLTGRQCLIMKLSDSELSY
jgi:O-methyltransferase